MPVPPPPPARACRPSWPAVLQRAARENPGVQEIGVVRPGGGLGLLYGRVCPLAAVSRSVLTGRSHPLLLQLFCGAKPVEADLRRCCAEASRPGAVQFVLHAENFGV